MYSSFVQAHLRHTTVEDSVCHCTYLIENAQRTMKPGVPTWVFVIDCTGKLQEGQNLQLVIKVGFYTVLGVSNYLNHL